MIKKIVESGHNRSSYHGLFKDWEKLDIQRLLRIMVTQEFLREDLIFSKEIPQAYIYLGSRVDVIMKEDLYIKFALTRKENAKSNLAITTSTAGSVSSKKKNNLEEQLREITDRCYSDLLDLCRTIAAARNATMASVMNIQALKAMAEQLPETEVDMCSIPHVTKANFDKYGERLLEITRKYAAEKLFILINLQEANETEDNEKYQKNRDNTENNNDKSTKKYFDNNEDDEDWSLAAANQGNATGTKNGANFNNYSYRGGKRKRSWRGGNKSKYQKTTDTLTPSTAFGKKSKAASTRTTKTSTGSRNWIVTKKQSTFIFEKINRIYKFLIIIILDTNGTAPTFQLLPIPKGK